MAEVHLLVEVGELCYLAAAAERPSLQEEVAVGLEGAPLVRAEEMGETDQTLWKLLRPSSL